MNSSNKMNNVLLVLLSASVIATIGTIFYHFVDTSYETETAIRATADESKYFEGVYVRDENVLSYSGTGAVSYQAPDGGKIAVNDVIAEVYPDESAIEKEQQIKALQDKLNVLERIPARWNRRSRQTSPGRSHSITKRLCRAGTAVT